MVKQKVAQLRTSSIYLFSIQTLKSFGGIECMVYLWVCMCMFMCVGVACVHISSCIFSLEVTVGCLP